MKATRRSMFFVDRKVQGALVVRTAISWMFCLFSVALMLICYSAVTGPPMPFIDLLAAQYHRYGPCLLASLLLLPVAAMDVLRLSNRFVGPVSRLRSALGNLAAGQPIEPIQFRDNDYWRDLANDLNQVAARLQQADSRP